MEWSKQKKSQHPFRDAGWLTQNSQFTLPKVSDTFRSSRKHTGRKSHHEHHMPGRLKKRSAVISRATCLLGFLEQGFQGFSLSLGLADLVCARCVGVDSSSSSSS
jgi:hypothetical protein